MRSGARQALVASLALTILLFYVPYGRVIGRPLVWLSTLAHELGHGLAAMLVGASFDGFVLHMDASGAATWSGRPGRLGRAFIAAGGLVGPAIVAAGCFVAGRSAVGSRIALGAVALFLAVCEVWVVGNLFAFVFVGVLALALGAVAVKTSAEVSRAVVMFLGVQLGLSVFSRMDYLFSGVARSGGRTMPSDVAHMAEALWLPTWFWGGVCALCSVAVLAFGLWVAWHDGDPTGPDPDLAG